MYVTICCSLGKRISCTKAKVPLIIRTGNLSINIMWSWPSFPGPGCGPKIGHSVILEINTSIHFCWCAVLQTLLPLPTLSLRKTYLLKKLQEARIIDGKIKDISESQVWSFFVPVLSVISRYMEIRVTDNWPQATGAIGNRIWWTED